MNTYYAYRDGEHGDDVEARIREAVEDFHARHGMPPATVVVHPSEAEAARDALAALGLKVRLEPMPGCLIPEVWLGVSDESDEQTELAQ